MNWKSCAFTTISMNYCSQITLPKAGAFNDPILKYLTGKPAKHHSYFYFLWLWLWTYKNIYSWGCDKIGFFSLIAIHRILSKLWRLEKRWVFFLKVGTFKVDTNKEVSKKIVFIYFFLMSNLKYNILGTLTILFATTIKRFVPEIFGIS